MTTVQPVTLPLRGRVPTATLWSTTVRIDMYEESTMSGDIVFFDLPGKDAEATTKFWESLFGWEFRKGNFPGYSMIHGPSPMGGFPHGDTSKFPRVYFGVDDLNAAVERVRELGGTAGEVVTIPSGMFANCVDDQGVEFSLFQAAGE